MQLEVASLTSGYGRVRIVDEVSFSVRPAEIVALIGRNGVGKTTLIKSLMGIVPRAAGSIIYRGEDVSTFGPAKRARRGIGYVPQGRGIFTRMTVADNLGLGIGVGGAKTANVDRAFSFFPILRKRLSQLAGSMSGGEQQQLAIARILTGNPQIILLDEPSEGIQPNIVQEIGRIIRRLRDEEGLTIIIVEQNLQLIQSVADKCLVMDKGAIIARIKPTDLTDPDTAKRYLAI